MHSGCGCRVILELGGVLNKDFKRCLVHQLDVGLQLSDRRIIGISDREICCHGEIKRAFFEQRDRANTLKCVDNRGEPYIETGWIICALVRAPLSNTYRVTG